MKQLIASLLIAFVAPVGAVQIDVTDDPNKSFYVGYERVYRYFDDGSECAAFYAIYRSGHEAINTNYLCDKINLTEKQVRSDLNKAMAFVKENSSADSFDKYFKITGYRHFTDAPQEFCIFRNSVGYIFTSFELPSDPKWKIISATNYRPSDGSRTYGFWTVDQDGKVIAKTGLNKIQPDINVIDMNSASDCSTNKPYKQGVLLPSR